MKRLRLLGLTLPVAALVLLLLSLLASGASGGSGNTKYQWDIINFDFATSTITQGGHASAFATGSGGSTHTGKITVTGHGTFRSNSGNPQDVTGGGMWQTFDGSGTPTGSGNYQVTGFVDFHVAPGSLPPSVTDNSGIKADVRSGLAVFKVAYDDGSNGTLVVSCDLPVGSPNDMFEGITASKGYVDYWERDPAVAGVNANRTNFHELH
ncbi:MAG: hypothetical protein E6J20_19375 [Chloroflexi bacterium]|nr:MAG: hypothetical protein E6J20_19375 [Chloroflexota bacterium]